MAQQRIVRGNRQLPVGWPVGSFNTYTEAQAAVDALSDREFPVEKVSIVGVDLVEVENVTGRLTWGKVLGGGALGGAWWGLFMGILFGLFSPIFWAPLLTGLIMGAVFGLIFAAISYGSTGGSRDFTSMTQIVAGRYDIICDADRAPEARDILASLYPQADASRRAPEHPEQEA